MLLTLLASDDPGLNAVHSACGGGVPGHVGRGATQWGEGPQLWDCTALGVPDQTWWGGLRTWAKGRAKGLEFWGPSLGWWGGVGGDPGSGDCRAES